MGGVNQKIAGLKTKKNIPVELCCFDPEGVDDGSPQVS